MIVDYVHSYVYNRFVMAIVSLSPNNNAGVKLEQRQKRRRYSHIILGEGEREAWGRGYLCDNIYAHKIMASEL